MPDSVSIIIGKQARELRFTIKAVAQAERFLGGEDIHTVTTSKLSVINLCRIAAAGFSTYGPGGKKVIPPQVEGWLEAEVKKLPELEHAVIRAVGLHLVETGKMTPEDLALVGEALASAAPASAGTDTSSSSAGSGSTPTST